MQEEGEDSHDKSDSEINSQSVKGIESSIHDASGESAESVNLLTPQRDQPELTKQQQNLDHDQSGNKKRKLSQSPQTLNAFEEIATTFMNLIKEIKEPVKRSKDNPESQCELVKNKRYKTGMEDQMETENQDLQQFLREYGIEENTSVIDVRTVLEMFHKLTVSMAEQTDRKIQQEFEANRKQSEK